MNRKYFKNLIPEINTTVNLKALELTIPYGFNYTLNGIEELQLLNDQLLEYGLQIHNVTFMGCLKIVEANKNAKPIEKDCQISKRLRYYLELFNSQNSSDK